MKYLYYGIELSKAQVEAHTEDIDDLQKSLHVTFKFGINEQDLESVLPFLGKTISIKIVAVGKYFKDVNGQKVLANIGWEIDKSSFGILETLYANSATPHVTLWISKEKDSAGKKIGKAVETKLCDFVPCTPFEVDATFGLFDQNNEFYQEA